MGHRCLSTGGTEVSSTDHSRPIPSGRPGRSKLLRPALHGCDLGLAYAVVVLAIAVVLTLAPASTRHDVIMRCSTNLANLHRRPLWVLAASPFVLSSWIGLWQVPLLLVLYSVAQRWVGRIATVFVAVVGHVGATLMVATLLGAGLFHGWLQRSVAHASDVGVSYGLACVAGFVVLRIAKRWRNAYLAAAVGYVAGPLLISPTFTGVGHLTALILGLGLALLARQVRASTWAERDNRAGPAALWTDRPGGGGAGTSSLGATTVQENRATGTPSRS